MEKYGIEYEIMGIPKYYRMPPEKRKSWEVNLLIKDGGINHNAIVSTILELKKRGIIEIIERGSFSRRRNT